MDNVGGEIRVYGAPGEEGGAKSTFIGEGYFKDVEITLEIHPSNENILTAKSLVLDPIDIEFFGKSAHTWFYPEEGGNYT